MPHDDYNGLLLQILEKHAPIKTKCVRGNDQPFMTKELRKAHMKRTMLLNRYRKNRNAENNLAYKRQRNICTKLLKSTKAFYYKNMQLSKVSDNRKFWSTVKPLFSEKCISTDSITLIENKVIISDDKQVADILTASLVTL